MSTGGRAEHPKHTAPQRRSSAMVRAIAALGFVVLIGVTALSGCNAPTLPLPPPAALSASSPDPMTGLVTVSGEALPGAFVSCVNTRLESGVIVRADAGGLFSLEIQAQRGDSLLVWQQLDNNRGPFTELCIECTVRDF